MRTRLPTPSARGPAILWHLLAYALVLAGVSAAVPLDSSFGSDDGAYGGQVWALRQGSWVLDRPLPVVSAEHEGWLNGAIVAGGPVPYSTSPAWIRLLEASAAVVHGRAEPADPAEPAGAPDHTGPIGATEPAERPPVGERAGDLGLGLHLPGLVAALVAAAAAWRLAGRWNRRAAPLAFWLVALSPVLVDTTTLWAHTMGTACGGLAMVAVAELWHRPGAAGGQWSALGWRLALVAALAAGAAVRTEAVFWTAAVVATAVAVERTWAMAVTALSSAVAAATVWALNRAWGASLRSPRLAVETSVETLRDSQGWLASRVPAAWRLLGTWPGHGPGQLLSLGGVTAALVGALLLRQALASPSPVASPAPGSSAAGPGRGPAGTIVPTTVLSLAAALYLVKAVVASDVLIPGIVAAWPAVVVALVAGRWRTAEDPAPTVDPRWLLAPVGLLTAAVLITQYDSSGGLQWGGRYLSMAYVPLAAAAAIAALPLISPSRDLMTGGATGGAPRAQNPRPAWALGVALAALALAPAVTGVATSHRLHTTHAMIVDLTTTPAAEVVVTEVGALPRIGWTALPTTYYRAEADTLAPLLADLAGAGVRSVNVAGLTAAEVDGVAGWHLSATNTSPHGTIRHLTRP